jgi:hypothetical protein
MGENTSQKQAVLGLRLRISIALPHQRYSPCRPAAPVVQPLTLATPKPNPSRLPIGWMGGNNESRYGGAFENKTVVLLHIAQIQQLQSGLPSSNQWRSMADACLADYESMVFGALERSRSQDIATEGTISIT